MGCIYSKKNFVVNEDIQGQDRAAQEIFDTLGLSQNDVDLLYTAFWDIDADSSGLIRPIELFAYFQVEATTFEKGVFALFDEDKSGYINFMEFVCSVWNLLTLPEPDLGSIAYLMKDPSGTSALKFSDIRSVLEIMHKKNVELDPSLLTVFMKLRKDHNGLLTMAEFCRWTYHNSSVTVPLMMLQLHLRLKIIGESFWVRMSNERRAHEEQGQLDFIRRLQADVVRRNLAYKRRLAAIENERQRLIRRGLGKEGDCRDNVVRKESLLLGYFSLKNRFSFRESFRRRLSIQSSRTAPSPSGDLEASAANDGKKLSSGGAPRPRRSFLVKPSLVRKEAKKGKGRRNGAADSRDHKGSDKDSNGSGGTAQSESSKKNRKKPQPPQQQHGN